MIFKNFKSDIRLIEKQINNNFNVEKLLKNLLKIKEKMIFNWINQNEEQLKGILR